MSFYTISLIVTGTASVCLGIFVLLQGKNKLPNASLCFYTLAVGVWCLAQAAGEIVPDKGAVLFWTRVNLAGAIMIPSLYYLFVSAFLEEIGQDKLALTANLAISANFLVLDLFTPFMVADVASRTSYRYYPVPGQAYALFALFFVWCVAAGMLKLLKAARGASLERKNQILYIILASVLGFGGGATAFFPVFQIEFPSLAHYFVPLYIVIAVYAILKHRLLDIRLVLRSGLIYSILTLFFTGSYALLIFYFGKAFQMLTGWNSFFATIGLVFLAVLIFDPLRRYVQSAVDRVFFRGSYYYEKTINDLSAENLSLYRDLLRSEKLAALGTMSAGMAHEIKNPLASIKGLTQILKDNLDDPEFIDKYTDIVPRQLDRINAIIETLLRIGRPVKYAVAEVDLCRLLGDIIKLVEAQLREKRIKLEMNIPSEMTVIGDPEQLTQALMNLVINAIDSMPNGGVLKVGTSRAPDGRVLAEMSDTGTGIRDEDLARIFDPFFTTKEKGAGLGLSITYRIIKEHGGEIEVVSKEGEGTRFRIWLCTKQKG